MEGDERRWEERGLRDAVLAGDEAAWRTIHARHFGPIYAFLHLRTGRRADRTEEAAGECWLRAVRRIGTFDPDRGSLEGWLRGIAVNVLRDQARRLARRHRAEEAAARERPEEVRGAGGGDDGAGECIALALSGLPARYQEVLRDKYRDGRVVAEIAARRGETEKAIESLLSRARAAFREAYTRIVGSDREEVRDGAGRES